MKLSKARCSRRNTGKDPKYLEFIRTWPCVVCAVTAARERQEPFSGRPVSTQKSRSEAAHIYNVEMPGGGAYGRRPEDRRAIPLCAEHHRIGPEAHHVLGKRFGEVHQIDLEKVIEMFQAMYYEGV